MTTVALSADPILRFTDNQGNPLAGGTLLTQVGGVNFPTYSDSAGTIQLPNPIVLNSRGEVATAVGVSTPLFLTANTTYAFTLFDANLNTIWANVPVMAPQSSQATLNALTRAAIGVQLFPLTAAEVAAGVTPTDYGIPSHLTAGVVLPERYGGAGDNSTLNDTPHANSMKVANAVGDAVVQYGSGAATIWKFNDPITVGATNQGRRVVGMGRVEFNFRAGISSALDLVTVGANIFSLQQDQPQFDNIQIQGNGGGRRGLVLTSGNRPLIRNVRVMNTGQDGFAESVTAPNWIEKADVSILIRFAGRHGWVQEILGTAGQNPFINEGKYFVEVRGVSAITAGGAARKITGSAGLGAAAKVSDNQVVSVFDAIYNTSAPIPSTSPVILDTVVVQNDVLIVPAWENTGTGGNPGAGPLIKVTSGSWSGLTVISPNWNSFWGDGTVDAAILGVNRIADYSFPAMNTQFGALALKGNIDNQSVLTIRGQTTTGTQQDVVVTRTGAANASIGQGAGYGAFNSTTSTGYYLQEFNGGVITQCFASGSWNIRWRVNGDGSLLIPQGLGNYANDAAAAAGGVAVTQLYRNGSIVMIRVV